MQAHDGDDADADASRGSRLQQRLIEHGGAALLSSLLAFVVLRLWRADLRRRVSSRRARYHQCDRWCSRVTLYPSRCMVSQRWPRTPAHRSLAWRPC
jgi:hypothetical protein